MTQNTKHFSLIPLSLVQIIYLKQSQFVQEEWFLENNFFIGSGAHAPYSIYSHSIDGKLIRIPEELFNFSSSDLFSPAQKKFLKEQAVNKKMQLEYNIKMIKAQVLEHKNAHHQ